MRDSIIQENCIAYKVWLKYENASTIFIFDRFAKNFTSGIYMYMCTCYMYMYVVHTCSSVPRREEVGGGSVGSVGG